jgi:hypothetical protein
MTATAEAPAEPVLPPVPEASAEAEVPEAALEDGAAFPLSLIHEPLTRAALAFDAESAAFVLPLRPLPRSLCPLG